MAPQTASVHSTHTSEPRISRPAPSGGQKLRGYSRVSVCLALSASSTSIIRQPLSVYGPRVGWAGTRPADDSLERRGRAASSFHGDRRSSMNLITKMHYTLYKDALYVPDGRRYRPTQRRRRVSVAKVTHSQTRDAICFAVKFSRVCHAPWRGLIFGCGRGNLLTTPGAGSMSISSVKR